MQELLTRRLPCIAPSHCIPDDNKILRIVQAALFPDTGKIVQGLGDLKTMKLQNVVCISPDILYFR
jgi:hypothetical protein